MPPLYEAAAYVSNARNRKTGMTTATDARHCSSERCASRPRAVHPQLPAPALIVEPTPQRRRAYFAVAPTTELVSWNRQALTKAKLRLAHVQRQPNHRNRNNDHGSEKKTLPSDTAISFFVSPRQWVQRRNRAASANSRAARIKNEGVFSAR